MTVSSLSTNIAHLADAIASRNVEKARAEMMQVLGDFPAEVKRSLENR